MQSRLYLLLCSILLLIRFPGGAQECGNCKSIPKVIQYDLDVQVPEPQDNDTSSQQWLEWGQLFWLARHANASIFNREKQCIRFIQASYNGTIKVGPTATNLVNNEDLEGFTGYLTTGYVRKNGEQFLMHMELQAACSRQTVAAADISFQYSADPSYIMGIAQQAVDRLSPLVDKIRQFELHQRAGNKKLSINSFESDPIKVTPAKKKLQPGQSTDVEFELKDCDGTPLEGREITFLPTTFKGFKVGGTTGGTVSPATVITDAQGKAKAKFTLSANAKSAAIKAISIGTDVRGCPDIFIGEALINVETFYSGSLVFSYEQNVPECTSTTKSDYSVGTASLKQHESVQYKGVFVSSEKDDGGAAISGSFGDTEDEDETIPGSMGTGAYEYSKEDFTKVVVTCVCAGNGEETFIKRSLKSSGKLKTGGFNFIVDEKGNLTKLSVSLIFANTNHSKASGTNLYPVNETNTEDLTYSMDFDADPFFMPNLKIDKHQSGSTTTYTLQLTNDIPGQCTNISTYHAVLTITK